MAILEHLCKKLNIYMQIVFYMFSCALIIGTDCTDATFENERGKDNGYTRCKKMGNLFFLKIISAASISLVYYSTTSKLQPSIVGDNTTVFLFSTG